MKKIISMVLMVLICTLTIGTTQAQAITLADATYGIKMNGVDTGVQCEKVDGELWLTDTWYDLEKIWPYEASQLQPKQTQHGVRTPLIDWIDTWKDYDYVLMGHTVYITYYGYLPGGVDPRTNNSSNGNNSSTGNAGNTNSNNSSTTGSTSNGNTNNTNTTNNNIVVTKKMTIIVNGMKSSVSAMLKSDGKTYLTDTYNEVKILFPNETKNWSLSTERNVESELKIWSEACGYKLVQYEDIVFLNNDGEKPVIVWVNGKMASFEEQQPVYRDKRYLIPIDDIDEIGLPITAKWTKRYVKFTNSKKEVFKLYMGTDNAVIKGQRVFIDSEEISGTTMIPVTLVADFVDGNVSGWKSSGIRHIAINY